MAVIRSSSMSLLKTITKSVSIVTSAAGGALVGAAAGVVAAQKWSGDRLSMSTTIWMMDRAKKVGAMLRQGREYAWCRDCEDAGRYFVDGYGYMLHDHVWEEAIGEDEIDYLCIPCVCSRLKRKLSPSDFRALPINGPIWSAMMLVGMLTPEQVHELQQAGAFAVSDGMPYDCSPRDTSYASRDRCDA